MNTARSILTKSKAALALALIFSLSSCASESTVKNNTAPVSSASVPASDTTTAKSAAVTEETAAVTEKNAAISEENAAISEESAAISEESAEFTEESTAFLTTPSATTDDNPAPYPEDTAVYTDNYSSAAGTHPLQETEAEPDTEAVSGTFSDIILEDDPDIMPAETSQTPAVTTAAQSYETVSTTARPASQSPQLETISGTEYNVMGENNVLVSFQNGHYMGLMGSYGSYSLCDRWVNGINRFAKNLPGVNVYSTVIPISSEFYTPDGFGSEFTVSQLSRIDYVAQGLVGAVNVDSYSALKAHTGEPIYARTDHHWNPLGAYYAAREFASTAGFDVPELSEYTKASHGGYVGTMYTYSKDIHLYNDPEEFTMYIPANNSALDVTYYDTAFANPKKYGLFLVKDASMYYCSFLGSDAVIAHINTDAKNGRTLVIFKESYGNALVPFLTYGFENIYVCDIRYFDPDGIQFCKDVGATDLLFAVCTMTAAGPNGKYIDVIS